MTALRVGIDGEALKRPLSGVGQYVLNLCRELELALPEAELFAYARHGADRIVLPSPRWTLRSEANLVLRKLPSFVWMKLRGKHLCEEDRLDVFWAGRTIHPGLGPATATVSTVHDLNLQLAPKTMQRSTRWSHRIWFERDIATAAHVVANSQGTASRLKELLGRTVDEVVVPGVAESLWRAAEVSNEGGDRALRELGIRKPYLLSVATLEPRKNVSSLIGAFVSLKQSGLLPDHCLVLVGASGWHGGSLHTLISEALPHGLVVAGYLTDSLMPRVLAGADALICASTYEGYGMPVLEARACGTKVVVSDTLELRESGGPAATIVKPSIDGIAAGIMQALKRTPSTEGIASARSQDWQTSGRRMAMVLERAVAGRDPVRAVASRRGWPTRLFGRIRSS